MQVEHIQASAVILLCQSRPGHPYRFPQLSHLKDVGHGKCKQQEVTQIPMCPASKEMTSFACCCSKSLLIKDFITKGWVFFIPFCMDFEGNQRLKN